MNPIKKGKYFLDFLATGNNLLTDLTIVSINQFKYLKYYNELFLKNYSSMKCDSRISNEKTEAKRCNKEFFFK